MLEKEIKEQHESFGLIRIGRGMISGGGGTNLFGSSIEHRSIITLEISTAEIQRTLSQDWVHSNKQLIEVDMSPTQFADMVTSLNMGDGVPVTIRKFNGKTMEDCPHISKRKQFSQETEAQMQDIAKIVDGALVKAKVVVEKKTPATKGELKELLDSLVKLKQEIDSNLPFIHNQFNRQMDKTVVEAKGEVEAFVNNIVVKLGMEKLREQVPLIEGPEKNEKAE
jgi:hypothetical protein